MPVASSSQSAQAGAVPSAQEENAELAKFRAEWLEELQRRKDEASGASKNSAPTGSTSSTQVNRAGQPTTGVLQFDTFKIQENLAVSAARDTAATTPPALTHPAVRDGAIQPPPQTFPILEKALKAYRQAVDYEQKGNYDEALVLYRQAFRLDDNVDRAYRREEKLKAIVREQQALQAPKPATEIDELAENFKEGARITSPPILKKGHGITGTIASIVAPFLENALQFEPEKEGEPVLLNMLPEELLVVILGNLDPTSIERFAKVSKKARVVSLDPGIWRKLVQRTYLPPQIPDYDVIVPVIEKFSWDFRRVYIEQPRLRLDGVYIATCHYVRPGLSENSWVNTSHLITYHRYLRFYPNGLVLSLLANEEHSPQSIIPLLKPTLRMNGLFSGQWTLNGTIVQLTNLLDASGRFSTSLPSSDGVLSGGVSRVSGHSHGNANSTSDRSDQEPRYTFSMTLNLRSRPLGRWNRMDIESYDSVNIETGDVYPIMLKHERPFWFSKVRSYS
ncbi:F-box protein pof7 [Psilocybe cubensis]|uniref:F-box protein pof7 n=2 Tax=Psilocybe cubensis TaxID=181762 RepID=A0ACB8GUE4_PSICU|nr:F-box protein pof7 [Psilocybe cubensis]KAH9479358.1 F-box protein pof7 [Psilocybe cubensis]